MRLLTRNLTATESTVSAELDDEVVLLNVQTGLYFGLDEVGSRIWALLEKGTTEDELIDQLLDDYDVEPDVLEADLARFIGLLVENGLVHAVDH